MSKTSWLVSGVFPGVERQPLKKLEPDATALLRLIERWRIEAVRAGRPIRRIALAYEGGRDGFWLARGLCAPKTSSVLIAFESPVNPSFAKNWLELALL